MINKNLFRNNLKMLVLGFLVLFYFMPFDAFSDTYIRKYTHQASDADSKITSRAVALDQVKTLLLQEIGTHIRQKLHITKDGRGNTYAEEDVEAITAGVTNVVIIEEKWNGVTYYLKAKIDANPEKVINAIEEFKKDTSIKKKQELAELKKVRRKYKEATKEIKRLQAFIEKEKDEKEKLRLIQAMNAAAEVNDNVLILTDEAWEGATLMPVDNERIKKTLELAKKGNVNAQIATGDMYIWGISYLGKDKTKGIYWLEKAINLGSVEAKYRLAWSYHNSLNNIPEALRWYRESANEGYTGSQYELGKMYYEGNYLDKDYQKAMFWFNLAAEKNDSGAQFYLGVMYSKGLGSPVNMNSSIKWYEQAIKNKSIPAKYNLGIIYSNNPRNKKYGTGIGLIREAARESYKPAAELLNDLGFSY